MTTRDELIERNCRRAELVSAMRSQMETASAGGRGHVVARWAGRRWQEPDGLFRQQRQPRVRKVRANMGVALTRKAREKAREDLLRGRVSVNGFTTWRVDKQVVVEPPGDGVTRVASTDIVVSGGRPIGVEVQLDWPRSILVTVTNDQMVVKVDQVPWGDEDRMNKAMSKAEEQCTFLNAHEVR